MADFNSDWKITGTPDPATPDPQPEQIAQAQPVQPAQQPSYQVQPAYQTQQVQPAQPVQAVPQAPAYQQVPAYQLQQPVQPAMQPAYQQYQPGYVAPAPVSQVQPGRPVSYGQPSSQQPVQAFMPGYSYGGQPVVYQNANYAAETEANLTELNKMINHFQSKVDVFQKYEKCRNDIKRFSQTSVAPFVWGILIAISGLSALFTMFSSKSKDAKLVSGIVTGVLLLIGAGMIALFFIKKKRHAAKCEELYKQLVDLSSELNIIYNGYSNCCLPPEFTDPRILYKIQSLLRTGRYVTIGNALNYLLSIGRTYTNIQAAKGQFLKETAEIFNGKPAFFNAFRYFNLR